MCFAMRSFKYNNPAERMLGLSIAYCSFALYFSIAVAVVAICLLLLVWFVYCCCCCFGLSIAVAVAVVCLLLLLWLLISADCLCYCFGCHVLHADHRLPDSLYYAQSCARDALRAHERMHVCMRRLC